MISLYSTLYDFVMPSGDYIHTECHIFSGQHTTVTVEKKLFDSVTGNVLVVKHAPRGCKKVFKILVNQH